MFKTLYPHRWFIWTLVSIFVVFGYLMWQINLFIIEEQAANDEMYATFIPQKPF